MAEPTLIERLRDVLEDRGWHLVPAIDALLRESLAALAGGADPLNEVEWGMVERGDMLGPRLGKKVAALLRDGAIPAGYRLVPEEPTEAMLRAWEAGVADYYSRTRIGNADHARAAGYEAMLAASPPPSEEGK